MYLHMIARSVTIFDAFPCYTNTNIKYVVVVVVVVVVFTL